MKTVISRIASVCAVVAAAGCLDSDEPSPDGTTEAQGKSDNERLDAPVSDTGGAVEPSASDPIDDAYTNADTNADTFAETDADSETAKESEAPEGGTDAGDAGTMDLEVDGEKTVLLVIFDRSGSMSTYWDGKSKWEAASQALNDAIAPSKERLTVGAILFPMVDSCDVEPITGDHQIYFMPCAEFMTSWESSTENNAPGGSTPLGRAFEMADMAIGDARASGLMQQTFKILLLTDGEPNCGGGDYTGYTSKWLEEDGILTYIFGLPGSGGAADLLDDIAEAGGTESHFSSDPGDTPDDLMDDIIACV